MEKETNTNNAYPSTEHGVERARIFPDGKIWSDYTHPAVPLRLWDGYEDRKREGELSAEDEDLNTRI